MGSGTVAVVNLELRVVVDFGPDLLPQEKPEQILWSDQPSPEGSLRSLIPAGQGDQFHDVAQLPCILGSRRGAPLLIDWTAWLNLSPRSS